MSKLSSIIKANTIKNTIYTAETFTQTEPHKHRSVELVYIVSGFIEMDYYPSDGSEVRCVTMIPGEFVLINSNTPHLQYVPAKAHMMIFEIDTFFKNVLFKNWLLAGSFAGGCDAMIKIIKSLNDILLFKDDQNVGAVFANLLRLLYDKHCNIDDEYYEPKLELYLKNLLVEICKCHKLANANKYNKYIGKTLAYIQQNYNKNLPSSHLSEILGISVHQLNVYLKQEFNQTFNRLMIEKRLESAKNLLTETNYSISSIAEKTGYASLRRFESAFKEKFALTPQKYRQNLEKQGFVLWIDPENMSRVMEDFQITL